MKDFIQKLCEQLDRAINYYQETPLDEIEWKVSEEKWSKKEILGHLIDSAINNLQRFTEIQTAEKPFWVRKYDQNALVISNAYQDANLEALLALWLSLNQQITRVMALQTEESLAYPIILSADDQSDLRYLMTDYVNHIEHHLKAVFAE